MVTPLKTYTADHRHLIDLAARQAGFSDPVAIDLDEFYEPLIKCARKGDVLPVDGVLVRDWDPDNRRVYPGMLLGMRMYDVQGIRFVRVRFPFSNQQNGWGFDFTVVDRKNYRKLYRIALKARRTQDRPNTPPVLPADQLDLLWKNTIGYLEGANLKRIKEYGGRAKRGVLLTGSPGNGKTMACRWIWEECRRRGWEYKLVTPDAYRAARSSDNIENLFGVDRVGIVFFDDMDLALRDRETVHETEDQAVFLSAMDGITINEGVVFVFTTNCSLGLIDRAFKRPGRIDLVLHFKMPDAVLRRKLIERWNDEIRWSINIENAVETTDGYSFAEIEELKNLLVMRFMENGEWDWDWALRQFDINRSELENKPQKRQVGFGVLNGTNGE